MKVEKGSFFNIPTIDKVVDLIFPIARRIKTFTAEVDTENYVALCTVGPTFNLEISRIVFV